MRWRRSANSRIAYILFALEVSRASCCLILASAFSCRCHLGCALRRAARLASIAAICCLALSPEAINRAVDTPAGAARVPTIISRIAFTRSASDARRANNWSSLAPLAILPRNRTPPETPPPLPLPPLLLAIGSTPVVTVHHPERQFGGHELAPSPLRRAIYRAYPVAYFECAADTTLAPGTPRSRLRVQPRISYCKERR